jgi:hypothetical protein
MTRRDIVLPTHTSSTGRSIGRANHQSGLPQSPGLTQDSPRTRTNCDRDDQQTKKSNCDPCSATSTAHSSSAITRTFFMTQRFEVFKVFGRYTIFIVAPSRVCCCCIFLSVCVLERKISTETQLCKVDSHGLLRVLPSHDCSSHPRLKLPSRTNSTVWYTKEKMSRFSSWLADRARASDGNKEYR